MIQIGFNISNWKVCAMHRLGPGYKNQFKFETEAGQTLSETHRKVIMMTIMMINR